MIADLLLPHQPLPVIDIDLIRVDDLCSSSKDDQFDCDPLPLETHCTMSSCSGPDLLVLNDFLMMEDVLLSSPTPNKKIIKRTGRVSFQDTPLEVVVPSFACLAEPERRRLWYRSSEIETFRTVARHSCRELRKNPSAFTSTCDNDTRGLELRTSLDRQYRKHLALTCVVKAQVRYPKIDPVDLAAIADRCSALPRQEALLQGTRDFCDVYLSPSFLSSTTTTMTMTAIPEPTLSSKRSFADEYDPDELLDVPITMTKRRRFLNEEEDQQQKMKFPPLCAIIEQTI